MEKLALLLAFIISSTVYAQNYFQQRVNHKITVRLDDKKHTLSAFEEIEYHNNSDVSLDTIYMHLWPNGYKSTFSALGRQKLENGDIGFHFSDSSDRGFIDSINFQVDGAPVTMKYDQNHQDSHHAFAFSTSCHVCVSAGERYTHSWEKKRKD